MKHKLALIAETVMDGVGKHVVDLIDYLDKDKFQIYVLHGIRRTDYRFSEIKLKWSKEVQFIPIETLNREIDVLDDLKAFAQIRKHLKDIKPEIVHCHSSKAGVLGRLSAKSLGIKQVFYTPHAYAMQGQNRWSLKKCFYWTIETLLARCSTKHTFNVSNGEKQFAVALKIHHSDHFVVVYNALTNQTEHVDSSDLRHLLGVPEDAFVVGCVARFFYQKNPLDFMKISKNLIHQNDKMHFIWVGTGEMMEEMKDWCKTAGILDHMHFVGHQKNVDIYLQAFDVFLSTSHYEGLPYTLVEAMRASCPIVASDVIGNNEVVVEGVNGYLYPPGDVKHAVGAVMSLYESPELRSQMKQSTYKRFESLFTIEMMIGKIEETYLDFYNYQANA